MSMFITCPLCGKRNGYEFRFGGEDKGPRAAEADLSPERWVAHYHCNDNVAGVQKEWWCHKDGCGTWFTIYRDTNTNLQIEAHEATT